MVIDAAKRGAFGEPLMPYEMVFMLALTCVIRFPYPPSSIEHARQRARICLSALCIEDTMKKDKAMSLKDLFRIKLQALYDVEHELVKALPKMAESATDAELAAAFESHLEATKAHVERLERIFGSIDEKPKKLKVEAIRGLIDDAEWLMKNVSGATALDAALDGAAAHVEHYEIAGYGTAIEWARLLGLDSAADLLEETLEEEQEAADALASLAASKLDQEALGSDENTEEDREDGSDVG